ncbi:hypothetical protein Hanom_Chr05g00417281 [Helianthus anomalus]
MSWFNLNYFFGESSSDNMSTFIPESSVDGSVVPDSYNGRVNDDHTDELVSGFHSHQKESLLPDLNISIYSLICIWELLFVAVIMGMGFWIMNMVKVLRSDKKTIIITFSLVMCRTYNKTLVSIVTTRTFNFVSSSFAFHYML